MFEIKNVAFWGKSQPFLIVWSCGVFFFTKVCILLPMVFIVSCLPCISSWSQQYICGHYFCKTVCEKKHTPCQGMTLIFPSKMLYFYNYTGFWCFCINWFVSLKTPQKVKSSGSRALPSSSRRGLRARTLRASVLKNELPANCFWLYILVY